MSFSATFHDVIDREYGQRRNASKVLARDAQSSIRAARKWLAGETTATGDHLLRLMARCGALDAEVARLVAEARAVK